MVKMIIILFSVRSKLCKNINEKGKEKNLFYLELYDYLLK